MMVGCVGVPMTPNVATARSGASPAKTCSGPDVVLPSWMAKLAVAPLAAVNDGCPARPDTCSVEPWTEGLKAWKMLCSDRRGEV